MMRDPETRTNVPEPPDEFDDEEPLTGEPAPAAGYRGFGMEEVRPPIYGQGIVVSVIVAALVLVLAIIAAGDPTANRIPLAQTTGALFWILAGLTVVGAGFGAQFAERTAENAAAALGRGGTPSALPTAWAVPAVATFAAIFLVATYHSGRMLIIGPIIAFLGVAGALLSRDLLDDEADSTHRTATIIHATIIHVVAFLALSAIYLNKMSSWISAPLVGIVGGLLVLETLERGQSTVVRRLGYALLGGIALLEAMIALNWWPTHGWIGGALLLVCFYVAAGVLLARTQRAVLRMRDLLDFGVVGIIAFIVLAVIS